MCPWSYAVVSTSTSTSRVFGAFRFSATHSVETSTSGCLYSAIVVLLFLLLSEICNQKFAAPGHRVHKIGVAPSQLAQKQKTHQPVLAVGQQNRIQLLLS